MTASVSRNAGGLFESVRGLAYALERTGDIQVSVFGVEDGNTKNDIALWDGVPVRAHRVVGPEAWSYSPFLADAVFAAEIDLLHSHGAWMYPSLVGLQWKRKTGRCHVITPQGMLDPWAIRRSAWKKRVAGFLYENAYLRTAACLHAVCREEAQAIRAYGLSNPIVVIPNGVDVSAFDAPQGQAEWSNALPPGAKVLLYLGRLHTKKGVANLIRAWELALRRGKAAAACWHLVVAGHGDPTFESRLQQLVEQQHLTKSVHFVGQQYGLRKVQSYQSADALVLPSLSEGQPMVVLESWASSLPVLITPACNLSEAFAEDCAIRIGAQPPEIAQGILALFEMNDDDRQTLGRKGKRLAQERFDWNQVAQQMRNAYEWVTGFGPKPGDLFVQ